MLKFLKRLTYKPMHIPETLKPDMIQLMATQKLETRVKESFNLALVDLQKFLASKNIPVAHSYELRDLAKALLFDVNSKRTVKLNMYYQTPLEKYTAHMSMSEVAEHCIRGIVHDIVSKAMSGFDT